MVKKLGQRLWLFCVFVFLYAPILVLIVYSFTSSTMIGAIRGFSLEHYVTLFTTKELLHMIGGTLLLAVTVAFLSTLLGTIGAIGSFYAGKKSGQCINFLNQIPIANAEVVTGFSICVLMIVCLVWTRTRICRCLSDRRYYALHLRICRCCRN